MANLTDISDPRTWRAHILRHVCRRFAVFGTAPALLGAFLVARFLPWHGVLVAANVALFWVGAFLPPRPAWSTALLVSLSVTTLGTALAFTAAAGFGPGAAAALIAVIGLFGALASGRAAAVTSVVTALVLLLIGEGFARGALHLVVPALAYDWTKMPVWFRAVGFVFACSVVLSATLSSLIRQLQRGLRERDEAIEDLEREANKRLAAEQHRREAEVALERSQKLETIGRLAAGVAHEFNNVLSVILTYAQMGIRDLPTGSPLRGDFEEIGKAGERAARLVEQLIAFSRHQVLESELIDLNALVGASERRVREALGENVRLETRLDPSVWKVRADQAQLSRALISLATNCREAMVEGGVVTIATAELDEAYAKAHADASPGRYAVLSVADTGQGMDAATQARVFEPFFSTKELGTGLGLSMVYGFIRQSHGHLAIEGEPGKGTTVRIYLPRADETANAPSAAPEG